MDSDRFFEADRFSFSGLRLIERLDLFDRDRDRRRDCDLERDFLDRDSERRRSLDLRLCDLECPLDIDRLRSLDLLDGDRRELFDGDRRELFDGDRRALFDGDRRKLLDGDRLKLFE